MTISYQEKLQRQRDQLSSKLEEIDALMKVLNDNPTFGDFVDKLTKVGIY